MTKKEKVLITVKAYPTLSGKYGELVCIAGIREDGSTKQFHGWARNPFLIVGTFHPPKEIQKSFKFPDFP